jgi:hypothetical protein
MHSFIYDLSRADENAEENAPIEIKTVADVRQVSVWGGEDKEQWIE